MQTIQLELADRFTQVFLLEIDEPTMLARLDTRQDNSRGRAGSSREYTRRLLPGYQDRLRAFGAIPIDARQPLDQVADAILSCTMASLATSEASKPGNHPGSPSHTLETVNHHLKTIRQRSAGLRHAGACRGKQAVLYFSDADDLS